MCDTDRGTVADMAASSISALTAAIVPARPGKSTPISFRTVLPTIARHEIAAAQHAFTARTRHGGLDAGIIAGQTYQFGATTKPHPPHMQERLEDRLEPRLRDQDTVGVAGTPWARVQRHRQASEVRAGRFSRDSTVAHHIEQAEQTARLAACRPAARRPRAVPMGGHSPLLTALKCATEVADARHWRRYPASRRMR